MNGNDPSAVRVVSQWCEKKILLQLHLLVERKLGEEWHSYILLVVFDLKSIRS